MVCKADRERRVQAQAVAARERANATYRSSGVRLVGAENGLAQLEQLLDCQSLSGAASGRGRRALRLCYKQNPSVCHRKLVADLAREKWGG